MELGWPPALGPSWTSIVLVVGAGAGAGAGWFPSRLGQAAGRAFAQGRLNSVQSNLSPGKTWAVYPSNPTAAIEKERQERNRGRLTHQ